MFVVEKVTYLTSPHPSTILDTLPTFVKLLSVSMSLYDGIITKKSDNDKDREQSERAAPSSLYANLLPSFSAAVIEQQPVKYKTSNQTSSC